MSAIFTKMYSSINSKPISRKEYVAEDGSNVVEESFKDGTQVRKDKGRLGNVETESIEIHSDKMSKAAVVRTDLSTGQRTETFFRTVPSDDGNGYGMCKEEHKFFADGRELITTTESRYDKNGTQLHSTTNECLRNLNNMNAPAFYRNYQVADGKVINENSGYAPANSFNA